MKKLESKIINVSNELSFHFLNLENYDDNIKKLIDENIASIWNGILGDNDIDFVKIEILGWFDGKDKDQKKQCGFIAEFFCHLYLKQLDFEQYFLFQNLEEKGSMKKGFDGLYQFEEEIWLYESKSSLPDTLNANHNSNVGEAYNDIVKKITGNKLDIRKNPISPWSNALNHASLIQVNSEKTLIENLNNFKKRFIKKDYEEIKNFNVIPSSSIFMEEKWTTINNDDLTKNLIKLTKNYNPKKMNIICINKKSITNFINYLS